MSDSIKKTLDKYKAAYQSIVLLVLFWLGSWVYTTIKPALEAEIAVKQLEDSIFIYSFTYQIIQNDLVMNLYILFMLLLLLLVWRKPIINLFSKKEGEINE